MYTLNNIKYVLHYILVYAMIYTALIYCVYTNH